MSTNERSTTFACRLDDSDLVKACAPAQPDEVKSGQQWMNCSTGETYPVRRARDRIVDLGFDYCVIVLPETHLRRDYVCTDPPDNVTEIVRSSTKEKTHVNR